MASILITGGAGYIGSVLTQILLECGDDVTVLDNFMYRQHSLAACCEHKHFQVVRGDARDKYTLKPLLAKADIIIPLAAIVGAPACGHDKNAAITTNFEAVRSICEYASQEQWVIFPNTNSGYGIGKGDELCTEESPLKPISLYGREKVRAEECVLDRENSIVLRLATVFGASPRMRTDLLLNDFVMRAVNDRAIVVFEGTFRRNFVHVRDVAGGFIHAIDKFEDMRGQAFNLGDSRANVTKLELCDRIKQHIPDLVYLESEIGVDPDKRDYLVSNEKIEKTGWEPSYTLSDGITELVKLYQMLRASQYGNV